jgi:hypothetical protein
VKGGDGLLDSFITYIPPELDIIPEERTGIYSQWLQLCSMSFFEFFCPFLESYLRVLS